jgi:hypothetical protein
MVHLLTFAQDSVLEETKVRSRIDRSSEKVLEMFTVENESIYVQACFEARIQSAYLAENAPQESHTLEEHY